MPKNNYWNLDFSKWTKRWAFTSLWEFKKEWTCYMIYCQCECWHKQRVRRQELVKKTRCCFNCSSKKKANPKHWMSNTPIYKIRRSILQRIYNPNCNNYKNYWWRWIKCEWKTFEEFYNDMWKSYYDHCNLYKWKRQTAIDRIDINWNYCKENCRWITLEENNRNQQNSWINRYWISMKDFAKKYWCTVSNIVIRFRRCWHDFNKLVEYMENRKHI